MTALQELNKRLQDLPAAEREAAAAALLKAWEEQEHAPWSETGHSTPERADNKPFLVEKRTAGLGKGTVEMAPDFDAPLPDSFWLGEA